MPGASIVLTLLAIPESITVRPRRGSSPVPHSLIIRLSVERERPKAATRSTVRTPPTRRSFMVRISPVGW